MFLRKAIGLVLTALIFMAAIIGARVLWVHYMDEPWTRDGRVRAEVINVAPDVSGAIVAMPVIDNQFVHKGDLIMEIDP
jgi:multidrug resistance efflux pump